MDTVNHIKHRVKNIKWKNVRRKASIAREKAVSKVKDFYMTDFENRVRKATSNRSWSAGSLELAELAQLTYNPLLYKIMMDIIWARLKDKGHNWRRVYKSLELIRYLVLHGCPSVERDMQQSIRTFESLENFQYVHPKTKKDEGQNVRQKAKQVVDLIRDRRLLEKEREQSKAMLEKIVQSRRTVHGSASSSVSAPVREEHSFERTSQRRIITDNTLDTPWRTEEKQYRLPSNIHLSDKIDQGEARANRKVNSDRLYSNRVSVEPDLLLWDDPGQDDEASISSESVEDTGNEKEFGEFIDSFSNASLKESSAHISPSNISSNDRNAMITKNRMDDHSEQNIGKFSTFDNQEEKQFSSSLDKMGEQEHTGEYAFRRFSKMSTTRQTDIGNIPNNNSTSTMDSTHSKHDVGSSKEKNEDAFSSLVSEWISNSHHR
eukprot:jgi/Galph1/4268/GphlegSOOS_G2888.1